VGLFLDHHFSESGERGCGGDFSKAAAERRSSMLTEEARPR
jgi:hypothetical protein